MKSLHKIVVLVSALLIVANAATVLGAMPREINFQGKLTDTSGNPVTTSVQVTFNIYNTVSGGTPLFNESQTVTPNARGIYSVRIGSQTSGGIPLDFNAPYYLGVQVGSDPEMAPRYAMAAAPYAMRAAVASTVDGLAVTAAELNQLAGINATVTAANLNTLTGGAASNADAMHTHAAGNSDTVDNFHASATPTANTLLALNASGQFPAAAIAQGAGSVLDADLLDGQQGAYYRDATNMNAGTLADARLSANVPLLNAANSFSQVLTSTVATGTAPFTIASTTRVANLNADMVDGAHAGNAAGNVALNNGTLCTNLDADTVDGVHASGFSTSGHSHVGESWSHSTAGTPTLTLTHTGTGNTDYALRARSGGSHAIYGDSAVASYSGVYGVTSSGTGYGVYGYSATAGARGVYGQQTSTTSGYGVYGQGCVGGYFAATATTSSANRAVEIGQSYYGIYYSATPTTGLYLLYSSTGIYFGSSGTYGIYHGGSPSTGIYFAGTPTTGIYFLNSPSIGVYSRGSSYALYGIGGTYGVYGNGTTAGVYGYEGTASTTSHGVRGYGYNGGYFYSLTTGSPYRALEVGQGYYGIFMTAANSYGIYQNATPSYGVYAQGSTYAYYGVGNLYVTGTISCGSTKSFVQDHPTDPTKSVVYVCLEGGEAGTYVRGSARLAKGTA
ncbi:MAG: hypothetical protein MUC63_03915, partial [Planctomycetes bacterium]|nr:hypothetical protein [Planctomycetota bacterium]